jgi:hypothetical protein
MKKTLKDRFREVDRVPTPWDEAARGLGHVADRRTPSRSVVRGLLAASLAVAAMMAVVFVNREPQRPGPDASWLLGETQVRCVEQYSPSTLQNRSWAFEGVITAAEGPADPTGEDPGQGTSTVTFDVDRWFWGGPGEQISLRTYASPSSVGDVDDSVGAHLLVSGEEDFLWSCGFTKPFTEVALGEFEAAAAARSE